MESGDLCKKRGIAVSGPAEFESSGAASIY